MDCNESFGIRLLADLILWTTEDIENALQHIDEYNLAIQKKKRGGIRKTYGPHKEMKRLQRRLLRIFLYKIPLISKDNFFGFVPNQSYKDNASFHCQKNCKFFLRIDFENAFPTVKKKHLRKLFKEIFDDEIDFIRNSITQDLSPETSSLFPWKKVRWFRKMINQNDKRVELALNQLLELILQITTYKGVMAQGIPTSPWLLNLLLGHSGLVEKLKKFLKEQNITVNGKVLLSIYADDFTISSDKPISWHQRKAIEEFIEKNSIFKINSEKTIYSSRKNIAPMITGLRITPMPDFDEETHLKATKELAENLGIEGENLEKMIENKKKQLAQHAHLEPRVPKKQIRKIRGLIHLASSPQLHKELKNVVDGHMANLRAIYGDNLPNQIKKPFEKYKKLRDS